MLDTALSSVQSLSRVRLFATPWTPAHQTSLPGASTGDPTHDKVMRRGLTGKASQVSRGPLSEHLPRNQNLSVYCLLYYTLLTLPSSSGKS